MSCDVMRCHVIIWCAVISCVVLCHVMGCDVMWSALMWWASSVAKWCGAMGCDLMSWWWDMAGHDVTLCGSKWSCDVVNWKMSWWSVLPSTQSTTQYYKVLQSTSPYSKIRIYPYYTFLQSITRYDRVQSTTPYYKVVLHTTKYYSSLLRVWRTRQSQSQTLPIAHGAAEQMSQLRNIAEAWTK